MTVECIDAAGKEVEETSAEDLPRWSSRLRFVAICMILPTCNGLLNGLHWAGASLHYQAMGWPLWRLGALGFAGSATKMVLAGLTSWAGTWLSLVINVVHIGCVIPVLLSVEEEWRVALEIFCLLGFDTILANDAIVFFHYGASEREADRATSMSLQGFVVGYSLASTVGGTAFDLGGWPGVANTHILLQAIVACVLLVEPCVWQSFASLCGRDVDEAESEPEDMAAVMPAPLGISIIREEEESGLPGMVEEDPPSVCEDLTADPECIGLQMQHRHSGCEALGLPPPDGAARPRMLSDQSNVPRPRLLSDHSVTGRPRGQSEQSDGGAGSGTRSRGDSGLSAPPSDARASSHQSSRCQGSKASAASARRSGSKNSSMNRFDSKGSSMQRFTSKNSSMRRYVSKQSSVYHGLDEEEPELLRPPAPRRLSLFSRGSGVGKERTLNPVELMAKFPEPEDEAVESTKASASLANIRLPILLGAIFTFVNNLSYCVEWALFAIYFKEQLNWNSATWAGVAQSSGDILAAVILQILARCSPPENEEEAFQSSGFKRFWYSITAKPYNLVWLCLWWALLNLGMAVPNLVVVIASQVLMGTLYVFSMQAATSMNMFYCLGDSRVFISLQLVKQNAHALGNAVAIFAAMALYEQVHPIAPFLLGAASSLMALAIIGIGFFARVGCGRSLEAAEAGRAKRLGLSRQKTWAEAS